MMVPRELAGVRTAEVLLARRIGVKFEQLEARAQQDGEAVSPTVL